MARMAAVFEGEHDFTVFAASDSRDAEGKTKVRTVFSSVLTRDGRRLIYRVRGSGFLKHMVRNLVGLFLLIGKGTVAPPQVAEILAARSRSANPAATAPAGGLFLVNVEY